MAETELAKIAGNDNVLALPKVLEEYYRDLSFVPQVMPGYVVKPADVKEVQGVVKWANETETSLVPVSSGSPHCRGDTVPSVDGAVIVDLSRMKRIVRVDPVNKVAMIEPGVTFDELQAELAKNVLGVEWVLPTGDVLKLGTGEGGGELYPADGPGFSLRGILRGRTGANGGHGIITKASVKFYPWYGPPQWERVKEDGEVPSRGQLKKVLDGYKVIVPTFPDMESLLNAAVELCQAEILYALSVDMLVMGVQAEGNDEEYANLQKADPKTGELARNSLGLIIGGQSSRELEFREKCVMAISEKWGGYLVPQFNQPDVLARIFIDPIWSPGVTSLRATGDFLPSSSSPDGSPEMLKRLALQETELAARYVQSGAFFGTGRSRVTWRPEEHLSIGAQGISVALYDPYDPLSLEGARKFMGELFDVQGKFRRYGVPSRGGCLQIESVNHIHQNWGPVYEHYDVWLQKVKRMLDPNTVADWSAYIPPEYPEEGK